MLTACCKMKQKIHVKKEAEMNPFYLNGDGDGKRAVGFRKRHSQVLRGQEGFLRRIILS